MTYGSVLDVTLPIFPILNLSPNSLTLWSNHIGLLPVLECNNLFPSCDICERSSQKLFHFELYKAGFFFVRAQLEYYSLQRLFPCSWVHPLPGTLPVFTTVSEDLTLCSFEWLPPHRNTNDIRAKSVPAMVWQHWVQFLVSSRFSIHKGACLWSQHSGNQSPGTLVS